MAHRFCSDETERRVLSLWRAGIVNLTPLWLLILAPFLLFPGPIRALALLGLPFLWLLNKWERGYFVRRAPFDWPVLLMLLMMLVSLYATFSLEFSLPKISGLLFHIAIFYAALETVKNRSGVYRSVALYLTLGAGITAFSLANTQWLFKVPFLKDLAARLPVLLSLPGAEGGFSPNQLAGVLLVLLPVSFSLALFAAVGHRNEGDSIFRFRWLLWGAALLFLLTLILTQSRGGWIGAIAGAATMAALWDKRLRWVVGAGTLAAIAGASLVGWETVGNLLVSDTTEAMVGNLGSLGFRQEVWRAALWGVSDFPFTGMGMGTFREVSRVLYPMNVAPSYDIAHAHNQFLQTALDLGIPGLVAYIALWLGGGYLLWQTIVQATDPLMRALAIGVSGAFAGFAVYGLSDAVALGSKPGFFWWWLLALSVGVYQLRLETGANDD